MSAVEVVDMLEAGVRDKVVAAAVRWHAAFRHCQAVVDAANDYDDRDDETEARITRCWQLSASGQRTLLKRSMRRCGAGPDGHPANR